MRNLAGLMVPKMAAVNPNMMTHVTHSISSARATQAAGDAGCAHALMLSFNGVDDTTLDAFHRGMAPPARIYECMFRSLVQGLDTSTRSIGLVVSRGNCETQITKKLFFAWYLSGSSLGVAQGLLMYITCQLEKSSDAALTVWLKSISEIRVSWSVPKDALERVFTSMGTPIPLTGE